MPGSLDHILNVGYKNAIVLGAQFGKLGKKAGGDAVAMFLENTAMELVAYLEEKKHRSLIIHTEDEYDPMRRMGLMSLKLLAKIAGLGWQGRSLLIVSPQYGPLHRLIAILTNMDLVPNRSMPNRCGDCKVCIEKCPTRALTYNPFADHPKKREDVLSLEKCLGDDGCMVCIKICPWLKVYQSPPS